ncbi:alkaline phosphatase family protein [Pedobacter africanus]|uniref:Type I phosphodiesterase / nucleotide pyrophosphatase n=1 Tax=Pedobacter africanus TaxID=151894 RepID=A0A1W2B425_9SPHI|nr:alkaline phosphatase family protein [Pedobacter africanus]SMC67594.1 Type I phosphodiesterase / nucleotide pyrophosphatase [Pedobacter africanus]
MKIHRLYQKYQSGLKMFLMGMGLLTMLSCNKDFDNRLDLTLKPDSLAGYKAPKILYIIVDGARGTVINTIQAPNLTAISENALQTFNGVSDENGLSATSWADMLTGFNKIKHKVTKADFSGNNLTNYPMFFKQLKQNNAALRTVAFSSTPAFSQNLVSNADVNQNFSNDDVAVKNALVNELKNVRADVVLAEFNSVDRAGQQYGYDGSVAQYSGAILNVDTYIGEAINTLKQRPDYEKENWLVIVASNQGGNFPVPPAQNDGTLFSKPLLNSFAILYNPRFSFQYYARPNTMELPFEEKGVVLHGDTIARMPAAKAAAYNFGTTGEFTVEFKLKVLRFPYLMDKSTPTNRSGNAPILFKSASPANSSTGWWVIHSGVDGNWRLGGLPASIMVSNQPPLKLNEWYTLGFKIYNQNSKRWVMIYQDGVKAYPNPVDITNRNVNNNEDLVAGFRSGFGNTTEQIIADIQIYNTAIPDEFIAANACKTAVKSSNPYYNNLIGYWPATDGVRGIFQDKSPSKNDFALEKSYAWVPFSDYSPKLCVDLADDIYTRIPNGIDIPSFIYAWMNVKTINLGLDGKTWIPVYKDVKP